MYSVLPPRIDNRVLCLVCNLLPNLQYTQNYVWCIECEVCVSCYRFSVSTDQCAMFNYSFHAKQTLFKPLTGIIQLTGPFCLQRYFLLANFLQLFIIMRINPYPTAFPYGNGVVLHFYQQQDSSTTKTVHKVINKGLKTYVYSLHTGENFH